MFHSLVQWGETLIWTRTDGGFLSFMLTDKSLSPLKASSRGTMEVMNQESRLWKRNGYMLIQTVCLFGTLQRTDLPYGDEKHKWSLLWEEIWEGWQMHYWDHNGPCSGLQTPKFFPTIWSSHMHWLLLPGMILSSQSVFGQALFDIHFSTISVAIPDTPIKTMLPAYSCTSYHIFYS